MPLVFLDVGDDEAEVRRDQPLGGFLISFLRAACQSSLLFGVVYQWELLYVLQVLIEGSGGRLRNIPWICSRSLAAYALLHRVSVDWRASRMFSRSPRRSTSEPVALAAIHHPGQLWTSAHVTTTSPNRRQCNNSSDQVNSQIACPPPRRRVRVGQQAGTVQPASAAAMWPMRLGSAYSTTPARDFLSLWERAQIRSADIELEGRVEATPARERS